MNTEHRTSYWATVDFYRSFLFEDGPLLETIADNEGVLTPKTLSRIAVLYSVSRTIPSPPEGFERNHNIKLFARRVIELADHWPEDLLSRAEACRKAANDLAEQFELKDRTPGAPIRVRGAPHSAVTKMIWFLKPTGWTVYDRYAGDAVLLSGGNTEDRQRRFYSTIAQPLAHWSHELRGPVAALHPKLHAERLIDKYLVLSGLDVAKRRDAVTANEHFVRLLPDALRETLLTTAGQVAAILPEQFEREARKRDRNNQ